MRYVLQLWVMTLLSLFSCIAYGQVRWGIKGGVTFSEIPFEGLELKVGDLVSYHAGLTAEVPLPILPLSLEVDLLVTQKGAYFQEKGFAEVFRSNHVDLPVSLKLCWLKLAGLRLLAQAGPYFSYRLDSNVDDVLRRLDKLGTLSPQKLGVGYQVGVGLELIRALELSVAYSSSLIDDYRYRGVAPAFEDFRRARDKFFCVSLGIKL